MRKYSAVLCSLLLLIAFCGVEYYLRVYSGARIGSNLYKGFYYVRCAVLGVGLLIALLRQTNLSPEPKTGTLLRLAFLYVFEMFRFVVLPGMIVLGFLLRTSEGSPAFLTGMTAMATVGTLAMLILTVGYSLSFFEELLDKFKEDHENTYNVIKVTLITVSLVSMVAVFVYAEYYLRIHLGNSAKSNTYDWLFYARCFCLIVGFILLFQSIIEGSFPPLSAFWYTLFFVALPATLTYNLAPIRLETLVVFIIGAGAFLIVAILSGGGENSNEKDNVDEIARKDAEERQRRIAEECQMQNRKRNPFIF